MKLTPYAARDVIFDDHYDWKRQTKDTIVAKTRWGLKVEAIFEYTPSNRFYLFSWLEGVTKEQNEIPFEYDDEVIPVEVEKKSIIVEKWIKKEN